MDDHGNERGVGMLTTGLGLLLLCCSAAQAPETPAHGLALQGEEAEVFLASARVVEMRPIGVGITQPQRVTLSDGTRTLRAVWKTIDEFRPTFTRDKTGGFRLGQTDSYKYEIAAYELDKLLGLHLVPPTVERDIDGKTGSLQLWVEGSFTEADRQEQKLMPKNPGRWGARMSELHFLNQLIYNTDSKNIRNILFDQDFEVYAIDHSRSFRPYRVLPAAEQLMRFRGPVLERLRGLDRRTVEEKLGPWLRKAELEALLVRRDVVVARADARIAESGEEVVLIPEPSIEP
jgi:hypothetical protein